MFELNQDTVIIAIEDDQYLMDVSQGWAHANKILGMVSEANESPTGEVVTVAISHKGSDQATFLQGRLTNDEVVAIESALDKAISLGLARQLAPDAIIDGLHDDKDDIGYHYTKVFNSPFDMVTFFCEYGGERLRYTLPRVTLSYIVNKYAADQGSTECAVIVPDRIVKLTLSDERHDQFLGDLANYAGRRPDIIFRPTDYLLIQMESTEYLFDLDMGWGDLHDIIEDINDLDGAIQGRTVTVLAKFDGVPETFARHAVLSDSSYETVLKMVQASASNIYAYDLRDPQKGRAASYDSHRNIKLSNMEVVQVEANYNGMTWQGKALRPYIEKLLDYMMYAHSESEGHEWDAGINGEFHIYNLDALDTAQVQSSLTHVLGGPSPDPRRPVGPTMAKVLFRKGDGVLLSFDVNETHSGQMVGLDVARVGDDGQSFVHNAIMAMVKDQPIALSFDGKKVTYRLLVQGDSVRGPYYLHKVISNEDDSLVLQYLM